MSKLSQNKLNKLSSLLNHHVKQPPQPDMEVKVEAAVVVAVVWVPVMVVVAKLRTKLSRHWINHGTLNASNARVVGLLSQLGVVAELL